MKQMDEYGAIIIEDGVVTNYGVIYPDMKERLGWEDDKYKDMTDFYGDEELSFIVDKDDLLIFENKKIVDNYSVLNDGLIHKPKYQVTVNDVRISVQKRWHIHYAKFTYKGKECVIIYGKYIINNIKVLKSVIKYIFTGVERKRFKLFLRELITDYDRL